MDFKIDGDTSIQKIRASYAAVFIHRLIAIGCVSCISAKLVLRFRAAFEFGVPRAAIVVCTVQHGLVPGRLPKTCERRTTRIRARAVDGIMTFKTWDTEFRNPDTVAYLQGLADEESVCKHIVGSRPTGGVPLVDRGRQGPARRQMLSRKHALAQLPRLEGLSRCSRLTKNMKRTLCYLLPESLKVIPF